MAKFKQACFAHDLSKKFQIFAAVHNSRFKFSSKEIYSDISANLRGYNRIAIVCRLAHHNNLPLSHNRFFITCNADFPII